MVIGFPLNNSKVFGFFQGKLIMGQGPGAMHLKFSNLTRFLSKFCLIVLMWDIIKGRPESERIGGNTGSTANCVLSDICLIETADGDGTLNNVSMKDGCL